MTFIYHRICYRGRSFDLGNGHQLPFWISNQLLMLCLSLIRNLAIYMDIREFDLIFREANSRNDNGLRLDLFLRDVVIFEFFVQLLDVLAELRHVLAQSGPLVWYACDYDVVVDLVFGLCVAWMVLVWVCLLIF